jgi:hypothetical protein
LNFTPPLQGVEPDYLSFIPLKQEMVLEGEASSGGGGGGRSRFPGMVFRALLVFGGLALLKRLRKSTTRWDHARAVADALSGEKV